MITARELVAGFYGTCLVYRFKPTAWDVFDKTPRGFWAAFIVPLLLAPLQLGHRVFEYSADKNSLGFIPFLIVQVLSYVVMWTLFPFVMMYIARLLGRARRYLWYMVPYIWMQLPMGLVLFSIQLLTDFHILPPAVLSVVSPLTLVVYAVFGTYVAGIGLQIATGTAVGLVVLDYVLGLIAEQLISQI